MSSIPEHGANALHLAADRGNLEAVEQLLDYCENLEFVDALDSYGHTPLMKALQCNDTELALLLLQHGARHDLDEWAQVVPKRFFSRTVQAVLRNMLRSKQQFENNYNNAYFSV